MINRIRRNYLRLALPLILIALLAAAVLLWVTRLGILYAFKQPSELSSVAGLSAAELEGRYVSVKVDELGDTFSYYGYTDENEEKVVVERYCVYFAGDKFLTVRVTGSDLSLLQAYDDAKSQVEAGLIGSLKEVHPGTLTGTITDTLNDKVYGLLVSWIKDNYLTGKNADDVVKQAILAKFNISADTAEGTADDSEIYKDVIIPLQLEAGYYGIMPRQTVIILSLIALAFLLAALVLLVSLFLGLWERPLRRYIKLYGKSSLINDYNTGTDFKKTLHIGSSFIWWFKGLFAYITDIPAVIWAYPRSRRLEGGKLTWYLVLKTEDMQEFSVHLSDTATVQAALDMIKSKGYPLVTGYDKEKQELYERDMPTFKARAKNGA
jgi:hypothetical protein